MLKDSCRRFRQRFAPVERTAAAHRASCPACDAWARLLETAAAAETRRPLPESLRGRLRTIPRQVVTCRDVERLYSAARRQAMEKGPEPAAAEHLETCERCATLYGALRSAISERLPQPSPRLFERLRNLARRPRQLLPVWIADARYATAACALVTVVLMSLAGDTSARFRDATDTVGLRASDWAQKGETRGRRAWESLADAVQDEARQSRRGIEKLEESTRQFVREAIRDLESLASFTQKPNNGGKSDGPSESDS